MSPLDIFRSAGGRDGPNDTITTMPSPETMNIEEKKRNDVNAAENQDWVKVPEEVVVNPEAQHGVQKIEAVTLTWGKKSLAALLIKYVLDVAINNSRTNIPALDSIWLIFLTNGLRASVLAGLSPYVTSEWRSHSLLAVIRIVSNSMTAAVYIPMAKLLDVWGRGEGFLLMVCSATLGTILMATSRNLATFCAAQVCNSSLSRSFSLRLY